VAIIGLLASLSLPVVMKARAAASRVKCLNNLYQINLAFLLYLDDHDGQFFKFREDRSDGTLWYWGLETGSGAEGDRKLDKSRAKLAPYFPHRGGVELCPSFPYRTAMYKPKFAVASYGYGINSYMLSDSAQFKNSPIKSFYGIQKPSQTVAWADCIQINNFQAPASSKNPMLEEWYYLSNSEASPHFHFRHLGRAVAAFADGSVRAVEPLWLDARCDGMCGSMEPTRQDYYLRLKK
jgi:prepilin-type processing-associated H-X9-DG protein